MRSFHNGFRPFHAGSRALAIFLLMVVPGAVAQVSADDIATSPSAQPSASPHQPTGGDSKSVSGGVTLSGKQAGWKGLYPGRSEREEVARVLGEPASTGPDPSGLTRLVFGPDADLKFNSVYVDSKGLVKKIGWARFEPADKAQFPDLVKAFAEPTQVAPRSAVRFGQTYRFPEGVGLWGAMDSKSGEVSTLIFYDPKDKVEIPIPEPPIR